MTYFITLDLRPSKAKRAAIGTIQDLEYSFKRRAAKGDIAGMAVIITCLAIAAAGHPTPVYAAYHKGDIMKKAQPLIDVLKDVAEPVAYGCYIWAFIRYILNQRGEAKEMIKATTWGYSGIQILPLLFGIIKGLGDM